MAARAKILFLNSSRELLKVLWTDKAFKMAADFGFDVEMPDVEDGATPNWAELVEEADALISSWGSPKVDASILDHAPKLKILGHAAGSVRAVATEELYRRGIKVTTANPVMADAVAEWSLMATLLACRRLDRYGVLYGRSPMRWDERYEAGDIRDMTVGIWGWGDISKRLARLLKPLAPAGLLVCSAHTSPEDIRAAGCVPVSLETILAQADVVHLLAGLTPENAGRIGASELALLKQGATLINAGRARLVDEKALVDSLRARRFMAILDVFHKEPFPGDSPLADLENVILTPHNAGGPGRNRYVPFVLEEFNRFFNGQSLLSEIDASRCGSMTLESLAMGFAAK